MTIYAPRKWVCLLLAFSLTATACLDGGDDENSAEEAVGSGEEADVGGALGGSESDEADTTTTTEVTTTTTEVTTTTAAVADPVVYCALSHKAELVGDGFSDDDFGDPEALESFLTELLGLLDSAVPPAEIAADFGTTRDLFTELNDLLIDVDYNMVAIADAPLFSDEERSSAQDRLTEFDNQLCGPPPSLPDDVAADDESTPDIVADAVATGDYALFEALLQSETGRTAFIEGLAGDSDLTDAQGGCFLDNMPIELLAEMAVNGAESPEVISGFLAALDACDIPLSVFG